MISRIIFFLSFTTNISTCDVCLICRASERAGDDDDFVDSAKKYIWLEIYVWKMYTIVKNWITRTLFNCIYFYPVSLHSLHSLLSLLPPLKIQRGEGGKNKFRIKSKGNITLLSYQVSQRDNNKKKHNRHTIITFFGGNVESLTSICVCTIQVSLENHEKARWIHVIHYEFMKNC